MKDLEKLRGRLDRLDRHLVEALSERLQTVAQIARLKAEGMRFLRDHDREAELRRECPYLRVLGSYAARTTADGVVDRMDPSLPDH